MARGLAHSADVRAAASAALIAGESVGDVAADLALPNQTVSDWRSVSLRAKNVEVDALLAGYLRDILVMLSAQARVFADESWVRSQKAGDLAILHGVIADKGFRILEAAARAADRAAVSSEPA